MPARVQRTRTAGPPGMPPGAKYVGRGSKWGNPYRAIGGTVYGPARPINGGPLVAYSTHAPASDAVLAAVSLFRADIDCAARSRLTTDAIRAELAGLDLACWCPLPDAGEPDHCHAAVLLRIANQEDPC